MGSGNLSLEVKQQELEVDHRPRKHGSTQHFMA
jgi:hypothetical protein